VVNMVVVWLHILGPYWFMLHCLAVDYCQTVQVGTEHVDKFQASRD